MNKRPMLLGAVLASIAAAGLFSCGIWDAAAKLGGKTLTYYAMPDICRDLDEMAIDSFRTIPEYNGHDYCSFSFNAAGDGGSYEFASYSYGYATAEAEAEGSYAGKAWFRSGGERGTFTYDAETGTLECAAADVYCLKDGATTAYEADYAYLSALDYARRMAGDDGISAATRILGMSVAFGSDNVLTAYYPEGDAWTATARRTESYTTGGEAYSTTLDLADSFAVGESEVSRERSFAAVNAAAGETETSYLTLREIYGVNSFHSVGGTPEAEAFADAWKPGKRVTFNLTRREYDWIQWDGDNAAPEAPEIDETDGVSETNALGDPSYYCRDVNRNIAGRLGFIREKGYIALVEGDIDAARTLH